MHAHTKAKDLWEKIDLFLIFVLNLSVFNFDSAEVGPIPMKLICILF